MTHERTPDAEAPGGPQHTHDQGLPDARSIPVAPGPFDLLPWRQHTEWDGDAPPPDADQEG
jgi:hypothetical protein